MKSIKFNLWSGWFLLLIALAGCTPAAILSEETALPDSTFMPTLEVETVIPTNTPLSATSTPVPSFTPEPPVTEEPTPTAEVISMCSGEGNLISKPDDFFVSGAILYQEYDRQGLSMISGNTSTHLSLLPITQQAVVLGFSLDGQWLAYIPIPPINYQDEILSDTLPLVLLSASGERIEKTLDLKSIESQYQRNLTYIANSGESWINDHLISILLLFDHFNDGSSYDIRFKLLDLFEAVWIEEPLEQLEDRFVSDFYDGAVAFSPDMSRVLYERQGNALALRDIDKKAAIWADGGFEYEPGLTLMRWSPNSAMVAAANQGMSIAVEDMRVIVVARDGISKVVADPAILSYNFGTRSLSWSPNSRYLAFFADNRNLGRSDLYIYDVEAGHYLYSCPLKAYRDYPPILVWSPDSSYLALSTDVPGYPVQIFNIQTGEVFELLDSTAKAVVLGWSDKFSANLP